MRIPPSRKQPPRRDGGDGDGAGARAAGGASPSPGHDQCLRIRQQPISHPFQEYEALEQWRSGPAVAGRREPLYRGPFPTSSGVRRLADLAGGLNGRWTCDNAGGVLRRGFVGGVARPI